MKIFSGSARGRFVNAPKGARLRPTTDKLRLALFNALGALVPESRFLDLCCGSGSVGLEALSRGASRVVFVDSQRLCADAVRSTARDFGFGEERWEVHASDAARAMQSLAARRLVFDLIFLDPPYDAALGASSLRRIVELGLLASGPASRAILEHAGGEASPQVAGLELLRRYDHGTSSLSVYGLSGSPAQP